ncbi:WecB/TagA/CpsF family glycosyltransferase [Microbacterium sp. zg.Y909]|uniref:WecB/TagA/CpsF family glycosyltransferase n=1 Tax=Microbacterium sp. zg.Y909 TaxID=2969413 RepID=UPI00214B2D38|nr:WecB/TagA/CpsF family glycosyltransferase [Microbacterium sp. zg.Y909]MCR2824244.1 WecB/TagA/CpsF family glycosyltransferase [Microbacterium sp. zg.Y909]
MAEQTHEVNPPPSDTAPPFDTIRVGGIPFCVATLEGAVHWLIHDAARARLAVNVRLANAYNVALADREPAYGNLLSGDGVNFPDGLPVVWAMRAQARQLAPERVRGPSLFASAMEAGVSQGTKHFLLGSTPETLSLLRQRLEKLHPGIRLVGSHSPPFAPVDPEYVRGCVDAVRGSGADIVWVGLGTPKQDALGTALATRIGMPTVNVGAAFDFMAGTVKEAPRWVQNSGLEWLYRLASEPKRLWRRYFFGNARFLLVALRNRSRAMADLTTQFD